MISINKYSINSKISERYAVTVYSFNFFNNQESESSELSFTITIDPSAFISGFKANIDGEIFYGKTKEKSEAKTEHNEAKEKNKNAILITQPDVNISNVFEISTNIDAKSNISLDITTEQYLTKTFNFNQLTVQILNDFDNITKDYRNICYKLIIKDKRGIYDVKMPEYLSNNNVINMKTNTKCIIDGRIQSRTHINELILKYKCEQNESNVLFDKNSGIFCHVISDLIVNSQTNANDIEEGGNNEIKQNILIPRRVIFVIDKSGSMSGSRWNQAMSSTITAIKQLRLNYDRYSIILFSNTIQTLSNTMCIANEENISKTIFYLETQNAAGPTDVHSALMKAILLIKNDIKMLNENKNNTNNNFNFYMNQLVLITDGEPNTGVSDINEILANVKKVNNLNNIDKYCRKISIFSFGIGSSRNDKTWIDDLNHSFLKLLSTHNNGIYSRIKQTNINTQLNEFYGILSKPILTNIEIKYDNKYINNLTNTIFNTLYAGNDLIICGKLSDFGLFNMDTISATITAITGKEIRNNNGLVSTRPVLIRKKMKLYFNNDINKNIEKIWAYWKLQQYAKQKLIINRENEAKFDDNIPLSLAIKYSFITPWTSMIVVKHKSENEPIPTITTSSSDFTVLLDKINARKTNLTLRPSSNQLVDIEESKDEIKYNSLYLMNSKQIYEFIASMGALIPADKFKNINGVQLMQFDENDLKKIGVEHKLHRLKILLEIDRLANMNFKSVNNNVFNWDRFKVKKWMEKHIGIYAVKFFDHGVDGIILFELDTMDLSVIGVKKEHQIQVLNIIAGFKQEILLLMNNKHEELLDTMAELLMEIGCVFTSAKIQSITSLLKRQLNELRQNRSQN